MTILDRVLFREGHATNLAAARIVIALHALWILLSRDLAAISDLPSPFWRFVTVTTRWRYLLFPGHGGIEHLLQVLAIISLIGAALGVLPRVSLLASALLLYHLAPLETIMWNSSPMERGFEVSILALTILAFAPCADVWSVSRRRDATPPLRGWQYYWPLLMVQLCIAEIYVLAGFHKLQHAGIAWMSAANMRRWLLALSIYEPVSVYTSLARFLADRPALCLAAGIGTVLLELTFPIVLVSRRSRRVWIPVAAAMHVGIVFSLNIVFLNAPQLLVFVNWDWLGSRMQRTGAS